MRLKSRRRMMPNQFQCVHERLTHLPVHDYMAGRQNAACKSCHNENTLHLGRSSPASYGRHQLYIAAAHASEQKEQIKNSTRQQYA